MITLNNANSANRHLSEAIKHDVSNLKNDVRDLVGGIAELQIGHKGQNSQLGSSGLLAYVWTQ